ncbi:carbohydrate ABC transporter permease [Paenibacillus sp. H1-7]|uniref:carbohydrate ABC transporter permease n=1 Tax=Paenibacillus sp. H1-7 TaxID=2282849 RepID=UPI001EF84679|nr:carbohydrate ABC transporter permease [Paenibacillus sp. H1-7]ULL15197.1 carbohydrate ABC transporter permease [Paenibacillus sp. H1-7]
MTGKPSSAETAFKVFNYSFLGIVAFLMINPFWELLIVSVSPAVEASKTGLKLIPRGFTLEAYRMVFESKSIGIGYFNSIFRTVVGTSITVFLCFCTAYPLAKKVLPARNAFTIYYLIPMFFGGGLIPNFLLIKSLGLLDTIWALIIPSLLSTFQILIMRNFIMSLPESLEESALVDGASFFMILLRIIIPLSMPIFATVALWEAVAHWNAWFDAMIYTRSNHNVVLQLLLRRVMIDHNNEGITDSLQGDEGIVTKTMEAATVLVTIGPVVLMYPFLQKYFIKGVLVGSLKG